MNEDCTVKENCNSLEKEMCWYCKEYSLYDAINKNIKSPLQVAKKIEKQIAKKNLKNSEASKRGKRSKRKGYQGEHEIVKLLQQYNIQSDRVPLSGSLKGSEALSCDITLQVNNITKRGEVKRRKSGLKTVYSWLEQDEYSNYLFYREDNGKWIVIMYLDEFVNIVR